MDTTQTELETLERQGWDSLCDGTGDDVYGRIMTDGGVMVLAGGAAMTRADVVASLAQAPPWDGYDLEDLRLVRSARTRRRWSTAGRPTATATTRSSPS